MKHPLTKRLRFYFIVDPSLCAGRSLVDIVHAAIEGGATMIQLRNKNDSPDIVLEQAKKIKVSLSDSDIPFLINDYVDIAKEVDADGVHIGQGDMSVAEARKIIGDDKTLGLTAFTRGHYAVLDPDMVDYVGTGPVFPTKTDKGKPVLGVEDFSALIKHAPVPVVGIGGITAENAKTVLEAGADGVAMMRSISMSDDPCKAAQDLLKSIS